MATDVATFESKKPSFALNVNESVPLEPALAAYIYAPVPASVIVATPLLPFVTITYVKLGLSMSLATSVPVTDVPSFTEAVPSEATGGSLTGVISTDTVATFESTVPSLTLKVNASVPFSFALGV